jgi:hypothetical protein
MRARLSAKQIPARDDNNGPEGVRVGDYKYRAAERAIHLMGRALYDIGCSFPNPS